MPLIRHFGRCASVGLVYAALLTGCTLAPKQGTVSLREPASPSAPSAVVRLKSAPASDESSPRIKSSQVTPVNYEDAGDGRAIATGDGDDPFFGQSELSLPILVHEVQRRNPSLQAALAAWSAASERFPQVVSLEDPVFQSMFAPGSFSSNSSVQPSYFLGITQKIPWAGKLALRGQIAQAQTTAASLDSEDVRLRLAEATRLAFFDYYLVRRDLELNAANRDAVEKFRDTAKAKFESNQVTQQDILQADVELALLESRRIELTQNEKVAVARINTLLHRQPQLPLPSPPARLRAYDELPNVDLLRAAAVEQRPDLRAQAARIQAEQSAVSLALKEFYPDFEFMGRYDQFWTDVVQRPQVGMYMNIPIRRSRREAAVREAMFQVSKLQAEYDAQVDSIRNEVQSAFARLEGSHNTLLLYSETILPKARDNVAAAYAGYEAGNLDFLRLVEAERQLIELQEKNQDVVAEYHRRRAELERVVGGPISEESGQEMGPGTHAHE